MKGFKKGDPVTLSKALKVLGHTYPQGTVGFIADACNSWCCITFQEKSSKKQISVLADEITLINTAPKRNLPSWF